MREHIAVATAHVWCCHQVCIEALSINLDKRQLDLCSRNIGSLQSKVRECVVPTITGLPGVQAALTWHRIRLCWYVCSPG